MRKQADLERLRLLAEEARRSGGALLLKRDGEELEMAITELEELRRYALRTVGSES